MKKTQHPPPQVETPTIVVSNTGMVTITCATKDAAIHYTLDGCNPTAKSQTYSSPFQLTTSTYNIKAYAVKDGMTPSKIVEKVGRLPVGIPTPVITATATDFKVSIPTSDKSYTVRWELSICGEPKEVTTSSTVAFSKGVSEATVNLPQPLRKTTYTVYARAFDTNGAGSSTASADIELGSKEESNAMRILKTEGLEESIKYRNSVAKFEEIPEEDLYWSLEHNYAGLFPGMHFEKDYGVNCVGTNVRNINTVTIGELGRFRNPSFGGYSQIIENHAYMVHLDYDGYFQYESTADNSNGFAGSYGFKEIIGGSNKTKGINGMLYNAYGEHLVNDRKEKLIGAGSGTSNSEREMVQTTVIYRPFSQIEVNGSECDASDIENGSDWLGQIALFKLLPVLKGAKSTSGGNLLETSSARTNGINNCYWLCVPAGSEKVRFRAWYVYDASTFSFMGDDANHTIPVRGSFVLTSGTINESAAQVATPEIHVSETGKVNITCDTPGAVIHYTLDGNDPIIESPSYSFSFQLTTTSYDVRAYAIKIGLKPSEITRKSGNVSIEIPIPTITATETGFKIAIPESNPIYTVRWEASIDGEPVEVTKLSPLAFEIGKHDVTIAFPKTTVYIKARAFKSDGTEGSSANAELNLGGEYEQEALRILKEKGKDASIDFRNKHAEFKEISEDDLYWGLEHDYRGLFPGMYFTKDYGVNCIGTNVNNMNVVAIGELGRFKSKSSDDWYTHITKNHAYMVHLDYDGEFQMETTDTNKNGLANSKGFETLGGSDVTSGINKMLYQAYGTRLVTDRKEKLLGIVTGDYNATREMVEKTVIYRPFSQIELNFYDPLEGLEEENIECGSDWLGMIALFKLLPVLKNAKSTTLGNLKETSSAKAPTSNGSSFWVFGILWTWLEESSTNFSYWNVDDYLDHSPASSRYGIRGGFVLTY